MTSIPFQQPDSHGGYKHYPFTPLVGCQHSSVGGAIELIIILLIFFLSQAYCSVDVMSVPCHWHLHLCKCCF